MLDAFLSHMKDSGWNVELNDVKDNYLPEVIRNRYSNIPKQWLEFIRIIRYMVSPDDTTWFLGREDYDAQSDIAFHWNEWELICFDSAMGDTECESAVKKFWDNHLPIVMSVKGGYSYYAISMSDGSIVYGSEPEFQEIEIVASSFVDFIEKIVNGELLQS